MADRLPSWRPGATRRAVEQFLDLAVDVPVQQRVACIDNDGTLWWERPTYAQVDFFVDVLRTAVRNSSVCRLPEFAARIAEAWSCSHPTSPRP